MKKKYLKSAGICLLVFNMLAVYPTSVYADTESFTNDGSSASFSETSSEISSEHSSDMAVSSPDAVQPAEGAVPDAAQTAEDSATEDVAADDFISTEGSALYPDTEASGDTEESGTEPQEDDLVYVDFSEESSLTGEYPDMSSSAEENQNIIEAENNNITDTETSAEEQQKPISDSEMSTYRANNVHISISAAVPSDKAVSWRFRQVDDVRRIVTEDTEILTAMEDDADAAGTIKQYGLVHVLSEEEDGWDYVESGDVRGFIRADLLEDAVKLTSVRQEAARKLVMEGKDRRGAKDIGKAAECTTDPLENDAYLYKKITYHPVVVEKKFGLIATKDDPLNVRCGPGTENEVIAQIPRGGLAYILADAESAGSGEQTAAEEGEKWLYVESGNIKGYVCARYLTSGAETDEQIAQTGESSYPQAELRTRSFSLLEKSLYHTFTSVMASDSQEAAALDAELSAAITVSSGTVSASQPVSRNITSSLSSEISSTVSDERRQQIVATAESAIGCPYLWGGNDLYNGCDCSGFTQQVYQRAGINIPRTAEAQAYSGTRIPCADAQPGDLIFYAEGGYIHHAAVYAGTDASGTARTIESYGSDYGIIEASAFGRDECWACTWL